MKKLLLALFFVIASGQFVQAKIKTEIIEYKHGEVVLQGYLAAPSKGKNLPGILIVHEWVGHNDYVKKRAEQLAEEGYVAFALDMYGKGVLAKNHEEAAKLATIYKSDRHLMRERAKAGLDVLKKNYQVNKEKIVAIGYCFGGTTALELGRSGVDLAGIVSIHGNLDTPNLSDAEQIKGKVLVLHGGNDPYVNDQEVLTFWKEMRESNVDWQFIAYGGAVHSFSNEKSGDDPSKGAAYNKKAEKRSWDHMLLLFKQIF